MSSYLQARGRHQQGAQRQAPEVEDQADEEAADHGVPPPDSNNMCTFTTW